MNIHEAMAKVMADVGPIAKNARNIDSGYAARSIDDVLDTLHTHFADVGIIVLPAVSECNYTSRTNDKGKVVTDCHLTAQYTFLAIDGSSVTASVAAMGRDWADKATSKAWSMALKTMLLQVFLIPTGTPDPDTQTIGADAEPNWQWAAQEAVLEAVEGDKDAAQQVWDGIRFDIGLKPDDPVGRIEHDRILAELPTHIAARD